MKCVCGYEKGFDFKNNKDVGDEDFIYVQKIPIHTEWDGDKIKSIFACPKCGTLKLDT